MKDDLVRFGIAMEGSLLEAFDEVVKSRGGSRSEAFRDLARAEVVRAQVRRGGDAVGTLTIVYDHHVRELSERLTEIQHDLGTQVYCTTHVHLDHNRCLEVIVLHGQADQLQAVSDRIKATRGVIHGGLELITDVPHKQIRRRDPSAPLDLHDDHAHHDHSAADRDHDHLHDHHDHDSAHGQSAASGPVRTSANKAASPKAPKPPKTAKRAATKRG